MEKSGQLSQTKSASRVRGLFTTALLLTVVFLFLLFGAPWARDTIRAIAYTPPVEVSQIADDLKLTRYGQFLFKASQPELLGRDTFSDKCQQYEPSKSVLGCYINNQIYVFDIDNDELIGAESTTMAHELLHAAYQRLGRADKARLEPLLDQAYEKAKNDDLEDRMDFYEKHEPGEKYNELHSILGTEIADLPSDLEDYYSQYFNDRSQIVKYNQAYNRVFDRLQSQAEEIKNWLDQNKPVIESEISSYEAAVVEYRTSQKRLEANAASVDRSDPVAVEQYNSQVSQLNNQRSDLKTKAADINHEIDTYNQKVEQLNAVSDKSRGLVESLDSRPLESI